MAGVKGQKSGGFGRKPKLPEGVAKTERISFRVTKSQKLEIENKKGDMSLSDFILNLIQSAEESDNND
ncbi:MAG: hypothetical protein RR795_01575 [Cetobacterium sp.]|uniref:hypothetical protein n=1 Tax=Cetobacterium sp. TaxID=2071632 RepID=UPI002FCB6853